MAVDSHKNFLQVQKIQLYIPHCFDVEIITCLPSIALTQVGMKKAYLSCDSSSEEEKLSNETQLMPICIVDERLSVYQQVFIYLLRTQWA